MFVYVSVSVFCKGRDRAPTTFVCAHRLVERSVLYRVPTDTSTQILALLKLLHNYICVAGRHPKSRSHTTIGCESGGNLVHSRCSFAIAYPWSKRAAGAAYYYIYRICCASLCFDDQSKNGEAHRMEIYVTIVLHSIGLIILYIYIP